MEAKDVKTAEALMREPGLVDLGEEQRGLFAMALLYESAGDTLRAERVFERALSAPGAGPQRSLELQAL